MAPGTTALEESRTVPETADVVCATESIDNKSIPRTPAIALPRLAIVEQICKIGFGKVFLPGLGPAMPYIGGTHLFIQTLRQDKSCFS